MYDDNELMAMVQEGNKNAYESLVIKHRDQAIEFANSIVGNYHTAEDIVQECFAKIYINRQSYKPTFSFKTYLFSVIRNRSIDSLRRQSLFQVTDIDDALNIAHSDTPEEIFSSQENKKAVLAILASLQDDYKTALYLYSACEMSYKDIAKVMQKSIPGVKIIIYRARQKLKKLYEGDDISEK